MKNLALQAFKLVEVILAPFTYVSMLWFKLLRRVGLNHAKISESILLNGGIFPLRDHYYEPLINPKKYLDPALREKRVLSGIDLNDAGQLELLIKFNYNDELLGFPMVKRAELEYAYDNIFFKSGDAEYLYNIIRYFKPSRIIEIGSGHSTLLAVSAIKKNQSENAGYTCEHVCIEPYEQPWLEKLDATKIIRKRVEAIDLDIFKSLGENDILFIDSSHMIRPQGDVI